MRQLLRKDREAVLGAGSSIRPRRIRLLVLALLCLPWFLGAASAYNTPDGPNDAQAYAPGDPNFNPKAHGTILLQALEVLRNDGKPEVAAFFEDYKKPLLNGVRAADSGNGKVHVTFDIPLIYSLDQSFDVNSFCHYYNPARGRGFRLDTSGNGDFARDLASKMSLFITGDWHFWTLIGQQPAATDMADWFYAQAVGFMRGGQASDAMGRLAYPLHLVADCTVPQHTHDTPKANHQEYEDYCDGALGSIAHATDGGVYSDSTPGAFVAQAAQAAYDHFPEAANPAGFAASAAALIPVAERLTAGLLDRFYRQWMEESFRVVALRVDRAVDLWGADFGTAADMYVNVWMTPDRQYHTDAIDNASDVNPQVHLPWHWFFPVWQSVSSGTAGVGMVLMDSDDITDDDHIDIAPPEDIGPLDLTYNVSTGGVLTNYGAAAVESPPGAGETHFASEGTPPDHGRIEITLLRAPASGPITVPQITSLKATPGVIVGGYQAQLKVSLSGAAPPVVGAPVTFTSANPLVVPTPDSLTLAAGSSTGLTTLTTKPVTSPSFVVLSAMYREKIASFALKVVPPIGLKSVAAEPVALAGGNSCLGTVKLSGPVPPNETAVVGLSSSNVAVLSLASQITFPSGSSTRYIAIKTSPVTQPTTVVITARYQRVTRKATVTLLPPALSGLAVAPSSVKVNSAATGKVILTGPATSGGILVTLAGGTTQPPVGGGLVVALPKTVTVPAGSSTATFPVLTKWTSSAPLPTTGPGGKQSVVLSASYSGATKMANLIVTGLLVQKLPTGGGSTPTN